MNEKCSFMFYILLPRQTMTIFNELVAKIQRCKILDRGAAFSEEKEEKVE